MRKRIQNGSVNGNGQSVQVDGSLDLIATRVFETPLMIHPRKLDVILRSEDFGSRVIEASRIPIELSIEPEAVQALETRNGREDRRSYGVTDSGIAVIPVNGTLVKKASGLMAMSGMCTYSDIGAKFMAAITDPTVRGVLFDINSPGGETHGAFELSDLIHSQRRAKPIYAAANDLAASAAYAIASACDQIYVTRTGAVGSVGVFALHQDISELDKKMGVKYTYIYAGDRKVDGNSHEPLSATAEKEIQTEIDRQYAMFVQTVARNRRVDEKSIKGTQARCFFADNAVPLLADKVGTIEDACAAMEEKLGIVGATPRKMVAAVQGLMVRLSAEDTNRLIAAAQTNTGFTIENVTFAGDAGSNLPVEDLMRTSVEDILRTGTTTTTGSGSAPAVTAPKGAAAVEQILTGRAADAAVDPNCPTEDDEEEETMDNNATNQPAVTAPAPAPATAPVAAAPVPTRTGRPAAVVIAEICQLAGADADATRLIAANAAGKITVQDIREHYLNRRAAASNQTATSSHFVPSQTNGNDALSELMGSVESARAAAPGGQLTVAQFERVLLANDGTYERYLDHKDHMGASRQGRRQYMQQLIPQLAHHRLGMGDMIAASARQ